VNYTATVQQYLSALQDMRYARMVPCSDSIRRNIRVIARNLKREGTDFKYLVNEERKARILAAIQADPKIMSRDLANVCGVSSGDKFRRLIKQYTGLRIEEFRLNAASNMTAELHQA